MSKYTSEQTQRAHRITTEAYWHDRKPDLGDEYPDARLVYAESRAIIGHADDYACRDGLLARPDRVGTVEWCYSGHRATSECRTWYTLVAK